MQDETQITEEVAAGVGITTWPTTEQFMNEATRDEACAFAAAELLEVIGPLTRAQIRLEQVNIPVAIKAVFNQKISVAVRNLYAAMPNAVVEQVQYQVLVEQAGGPEKFAELVAKFEAEQVAANPHAEVAELPKIPEQWPVQLGADNQLHIVKEPEKESATVLQFVPKRPTPPTEPDGPSGGTPVQVAA
jgi:hypothetical protein